jgi:hypothetical protein
MSERFNALRKRGSPVPEGDITVADVQGYENAEGTLEESVAGLDLASTSVKEAVKMALFGTMGLTETGKRVRSKLE